VFLIVELLRLEAVVWESLVLKIEEILSREQDVMGESMDMLQGSCSQNTLKDKRLEHWSYRQKRNFIDRERLSRETHSRVWKMVTP
jgi:hypothetical protein